MKDLFTGVYPRLVELLKKRLPLAEEYLALTLSLKEAVEAEDTGRIAACIAERGELIKAIETSYQELEEPMKQYNDYVSRLNGPDSRLKEAREVLGKTRDAFIRVSEIDRANMEAISAIMGRTAGEGKKLKDSRQGVGKYAQKDSILPPSFIDELK